MLERQRKKMASEIYEEGEKRFISLMHSFVGGETAACYVWGSWETPASADTIKESPHTALLSLPLQLSLPLSLATVYFFVHIAIISIYH